MKKLVLGIVFMLGGLSQAAIVCEGTSPLGPAKITIDRDQVQVEGGALQTPMKFLVKDHVYDGHASGLYTAPGFAMLYGSIYGCIRDVVVLTDFRGDSTIGYIGKMEVALCKGGTTPDDICDGSSTRKR